MVLSEDAKVGKRYTVVIPKRVREKLNVREGQKVLVTLEDKRMIIEPIQAEPLQALGDIIGEPYDERKEEKGAEEWLKRRAGR